MGKINWKKYASDFMTFESVGDSIAGTILSVEEGKDFNGNGVPQLVIETGDGARTVTAGQVMLKAALAEKEPDEGDWIQIVYTANGEGRPGKAPAKLFKVEVTRKGAETPVTASDLA